MGASSSDSKEAGQSYMEQHFNSLATVGAKVKNATNAPTPTTAPDPQKVLETTLLVEATVNITLSSAGLGCTLIPDVGGRGTFVLLVGPLLQTSNFLNK